jgi:hypothetical protein
MAGFFDRKVDYQANMTSRLRSTLKSLERRIPNKRTILSENEESDINMSGEIPHEEE